jgi:hypothetical protein
LADDAVQIALSKTELDDVVANDLEDICSKIDRCSDKEANLLGNGQTSPRNLIDSVEDNLVAVYACVLEYSVVSRDYVELWSPGKLIKSYCCRPYSCLAVAVFRTGELKPALKRVKADLDVKYKTCEDSFDKVKSDSDFFKANQEILKWVSDEDRTSDHLKRRNITQVADQYKTSGEWLLQSDGLKRWDAEDGLQVYWLCGTGESAMLIAAVNYLTKQPVPESQPWRKSIALPLRMV